jgi:hypothetical protein
VITKHGPRTWTNVHVTKTTKLDQLISIDNSRATDAPKPNGFDDLRQTAADLDALVRDAHRRGKRMRALGSGWA